MSENEKSSVFSTRNRIPLAVHGPNRSLHSNPLLNDISIIYSVSGPNRYGESAELILLLFYFYIFRKNVSSPDRYHVAGKLLNQRELVI